MAGHAAGAGEARRGAGALGLCAAAELRRSDRHGPVLCQDDISQRRQHHPHPGLRQSDPARRADCGPGARRPGRADRRGQGLSRVDRPHRALFDLLRRRPDHRPAHASRPRAARLAEARPRDRCRGGHPRQAGDAYEPGLCRGRLYRRPVAPGNRRASARALSCRSMPRGHHPVPQDRDPRPEPVCRPAQQPLRRARRPDVARRRVRPVGAGLLRRPLARGDPALAALASPLRLAGRRRSSPWVWRWL